MHLGLKMLDFSFLFGRQTLYYRHLLMAISFYKAHSDIEHLDLLEVARRKMKYSPNGGEEW